MVNLRCVIMRSLCRVAVLALKPIFRIFIEKFGEAYMAKVTFVGSDGKETTCEGDDGMTLMEVAIKNSVHGIDADCGGACACATCHDLCTMKTGKRSNRRTRRNGKRYVRFRI